MSIRFIVGLTSLFCLCSINPAVRAEETPAPGEEFIVQLEKEGLPPSAQAPDRQRGAGPCGRLVIRGATLIDGTGAIRLDDETGEVGRVGGVRWTVVNGVVYDARELLADVRGIVADAKEREKNAGEDNPVSTGGTESD